ncbi:MAG: APC family permease [Treponema sp.]|jgi:APA family basic amino acid/polyamine antiporter|nr:APC family permease [Treponema sp.]
MAEQTVSTKELKRVLGFGDLMGIAIGQIIGAGIMSLMGIGIGLTGRSVTLAFLIAAVFAILSIIPIIITSGTLRLRGGLYTVTGLLAGKRFAGIYIILFIISNVAIALYALSFANYFLDLLMPGGNGKIVAILCITVFYVLNFFGIDKMAKVQNVIVIVMCVSLALLAAFGIGKVSPDFLREDFFTGGMNGLFSASALLIFACGGAFVIVHESGEAKNPTRDIPLACIVSTLTVAVLYGFLAIVASGVLPVSEVAYQSLSNVAKTVLPTPVYYFFMVGGAMFALMTTLNAQLGWSTKPILQACVDGWFPRKLAYLHPRYKTPVILLTIFYFIGILPIIVGFNMGAIAAISNIVVQVAFVIINIALFRLPKVAPEEWKVSKYKVSSGMLQFLIVISVLGAGIPVYLLAKDLTPALLIGNIVVLGIGILYSILRYNTGQVKMEISYEAN